MSHAEEIAKQDSIRVKITWKTAGAKHEVEFDARAIEWKRNAREGSYKTWQLTLLEVPRFFSIEEGTPSTSAPQPTPPVPATCCGHAPHAGFRCSRCACEGRSYATEYPAIRPFNFPRLQDIQFVGFDPASMAIDPVGVVRLAEDRLRQETEQLRALNEATRETAATMEAAADIFRRNA